ncbi:MAG: hypothetical protein AAF206_24505 [Bacteroidota bacterium]
MKPATKYLIIVAIVVALIVWILIRTRRRTPFSITTPPDESCQLSGPCLQRSQLNEQKTLKRGINGPEVCELQKFINQLRLAQYESCIAVDGAFGPQTEAALYDLFGARETTLQNTNYG